MVATLPSALERTAGDDTGTPKRLLALSAWGGDAPEATPFFEGRILRPRVVAEALVQLSRVVATRFHVPAAMRERLLRLSDPIVTFGGGSLRFEGFSSCASVYARLDVEPAGLEVQRASRGTTNVDFNEPLRAALAGVRDEDRLELRIDPSALALARHRAGESAHHVEKKVDLPLRWLRGLVEVQAYLARMRPRLAIEGAQVLRFLRDLPRAKSRATAWVVPAGVGLRVAFADPGGGDRRGVRVADLERLRLLEPLAAKARSLRVYADDDDQASAWVLDLGAERFVLALTREATRGFSGEGQALRTLATFASSTELQTAVARVRAALAWQPRLEVATLAEQTQTGDLDRVRAALEVLGASGLVGFDPVAGAYFHRVLPYDLAAVDLQNPRLASARELLARGAVRHTGDGSFSVTSGDAPHLVKTDADGRRACTCPWSARHEGQRGPCKHVLAVGMFVEQRGVEG